MRQALHGPADIVRETDAPAGGKTYQVVWTASCPAGTPLSVTNREATIDGTDAAE